jgi:thioredoxin reductase (NADPH)
MARMTNRSGGKMYDIAIIGGGPAGLSAAITARARNKNVAVLSNPAQENPLARSQLVENYPGMPQASGLDILTVMHGQAHALGAQLMQARVVSVLPISPGVSAVLASGEGRPGKELDDEALDDERASKKPSNGALGIGQSGTEPDDEALGNDGAKTIPHFSLITSDTVIEARSVIVACGAASGGKPFFGEQEYLGRGVSYCATCDGRLYRSAVVLVVGLSAEAVDEANFLAELGATVHYLARKLSPELDRRIFRHQGRLLRIRGDASSVTHCLISERTDSPVTASNTTNLLEREIACSGVFLLRPGITPDNLLPGLALQGGYIGVDATMRTNVAGVFAAGDCVGKPLQVAKAVGQGQLAAFAAVDYLEHGP